MKADVNQHKSQALLADLEFLRPRLEWIIDRNNERKFTSFKYKDIHHNQTTKEIPHCTIWV